MGELSIIKGDITQQNVDVIVNAANARVRGGGGVDGAIHRAGGPEILAECIRRFPNGLPTGDAGHTTAGDLPAEWVIHAVGPNYGAGQRDPELLRSCYRRSLEIADELGATSIAFSLISSGVYAWPLEEAAQIAVDTLLSTPTSVADIRILAYSDEAHAALTRALARHNAATGNPA